MTIIRGKNGLSPMQRLEKLMNRQLFQQLASRREESLGRITVLNAELCDEGCGVCADDLPRLNR